LTANGDQVPLTDAKGNAIGYFLTPERFEMMQKVHYDQAFDELSDEEASRILANPKRYSMRRS